MLCMETILKVRRLFHKKGLSQRAIAKQLHLSRHTIQKYLKMEIKEPPRYQRTQISYPKLGPFIARLEQELIQQAALPRSKRLTARRHYEKLRAMGYQGQYCSIAQFIRRFYAQHQPAVTTVFIPQIFPAGESYQFDWSTETVKLAGVTLKVNVAHFRLCHSRAFFIRAYPNQRLEMLIDAHNHAFAYFGGVPQRGIYDNMKAVVKCIGIGKEREFNERFLSMMSHFVIEPVACTPASGWEKGQVERQIRTLRKQLFEPALSFSSLDELNHYLLEQCQHLIVDAKHPDDKTQTVAQAFAQEQATLTPYSPYEGYHFELVRANSSSLVPFDGNRYSVPNELAAQPLTLNITAMTIKILAGNECVATHPRSFAKGKTIYNPTHYLKTLRAKPGALRNGEPFVQWELPKPIQQLQERLLKQPKGDKAMVEVLALIAEYGEDLGVVAAELALDEGLPTVEAVLNIIHRLTEPEIPAFKVRDIPLSAPPVGNCMRYNSLLKEVNHAKA